MSYANSQVRTTISIQLRKRETPTETAEVVVWRCSVKKVFLEISQNSQENTCAKVFYLIKLQLY